MHFSHKVSITILQDFITLLRIHLGNNKSFFVSEMTYCLKSVGNFINDLLIHNALLGEKHIRCLGNYSFDTKNVLENKELRPLNISD